ncbi:thioredoxin, putative [Entamoeba invadens IP1]|uniref:Thioredoxin, putative n=1 Tax=Entamoeba invadens IP1 TaxID=370355 RepID=A0A0A1TW56_ENTIV|nr:thioredoxin, putative [Entamoeba invadens IP1]ELP84752.1 thioredoxin, putative [Entamoeba invadens IP1]|eukprot:XP_004184098.1 thioredoxin, putative [Entamoeba invadens IP1]
MAQSSVQHINSLSTFESFISRNPVVIVDFFATWCGPCKSIAPYFEELARKTPSIKFVKVDVEEGADIAGKYSVHSMPTFILFKNGSEFDRFSGADRTKLLSFTQVSGGGQPHRLHEEQNKMSMMRTVAAIVIIFVTVFVVSKLMK